MKKIYSLTDMIPLIDDLKRNGKKIIHCHGVYDLVHSGHLHHFKEAKNLGDILVVTITAEKFLEKGSQSPLFNDNLRGEFLAALECIDFVAINQDSHAVDLIKKLKPHVYVKGKEYENSSSERSGKIKAEREAVESIGGRIHFTSDDMAFCSYKLLNISTDELTPEIRDYIDTFKKKFDVQLILDTLDSLFHTKVLIIGDAILDEYQYVEPLGQSGKGTHMVARCREREIYPGGSFAVANNISSFVNQATLLTAIGQDEEHLDLIENKILQKNIQKQFVYVEDSPTLVKKRYICKDENILSKLFETYSPSFYKLEDLHTQQMIKFLRENLKKFDLTLVCDFGNGLINSEIAHYLSEHAGLLAINAQINSGNRGYHVVTRYPRADYISLNEPELRLACHDSYGDIGTLAKRVMKQLKCPLLSCTRGTKGVWLFKGDEQLQIIPAFAKSVVDRVGAGDSYLAMSSLCLAKGVPFEVAGLIGSLAAAMKVQYAGNKEIINPVALKKYILRLMR